MKKFPEGITAEFIHREARYLFKHNPKYLTTRLPEIIAEAKINNKKISINRRLKCVEFNDDGDLQYVRRHQSLKEIMKMKNKCDL